MDLEKIVIGTWSLSGDFGPVGLENIQTVLNYAYENGFHEYDTAPVYGNGFMEFCLGKVFYNKKDVLINTKVGNHPFGRKNFHVNEIKRSVEESIIRLNGLPINTLFLHNPREEITHYTPILEYMMDLKKRGVIKEIGLSKAKNYPYENFVDLNIFDVIQDDVNLLYLEPLKDLNSIKAKFMARSPLASGLLSGNIDKNKIFHKTDHRSEWLKGERLISLLKRVEKINNISGGISIASLAKRFLFSIEKINKIIFGVKSISHINELMLDIQQSPIDESLVRNLVELYNDDYGLSNEEKCKY